MKPDWRILLILAAGTFLAQAEPISFRDSFQSPLKDGWSWIRESPQGWRSTERGLEIRVEPGNMWGPANNARNLLVRAAPDPTRGEVELRVTVSNRPTEQYEQVNLVWYYDDSHMVKLGQELVDGQLSIVMGREEKDRTRTISIIPIELHTVELRYLVEGDQIRGQFRAPGDTAWREAGKTDLPVHGSPKITIQAYQGPGQVERWATVRDFSMVQKKP
jgi:regulation of enolase protein 1 (concanavalin A-like superfamily)